MANLTRKNFNANKKCYSVSSATVNGATDIGSDTGQSTLFNLPANCLVTSIALVVEEASNSATAIVRVGGSSVITSAPLQTKGARYANVERDSSGTNDTAIVTGSGMAVTVQPSVALTAGKFHVIVQYIEYTKRSSELTQYTE